MCPTQFQAAFVENERVGSKCPSDGDLCKIPIFGTFLRNALKSEVLQRSPTETGIRSFVCRLCVSGSLKAVILPCGGIP